MPCPDTRARRRRVKLAYTGIEVKSGSAIDAYNRPGNTQRQFDEAVDAGTPARGKLDGEDIVVTRVEVEIVQ